MRAGLLIAAALIGMALAVQIAYARAFASRATRATKVVWALNVALLTLLEAGLVLLALRDGGR